MHDLCHGASLVAGAARTFDEVVDGSGVATGVAGSREFTVRHVGGGTPQLVVGVREDPHGHPATIHRELSPREGGSELSDPF